MNVNFSNIDFEEQPVLLLKNYSETTIQPLGYAYNLQLDLTYNEISQVNFDLPKYVNGIQTPNYSLVNGDKILEIMNVGKFILQNPKQTISGIKTIKSCKAYSLEYEFTYKTISLEENTYNFWNPVAQDDTILARIMERMPSWKIGSVSIDLVDRYRTFSIHENNLYNFIKQTLQDTYGCIFEFDTFTRTVNVRSVDEIVYKKPIYLSTQNLLHNIEVNEDSESVKTCLNVNGAEGLSIRDINPIGTNFIYNLDYYLTTDNMSQTLIDKWNAWKLEYNNYKLPYLNLKAEEQIQTSRLVTEQAKLDYYTERLSGLNSEMGVLQSKKAENISGIDGQISAKQLQINEVNSIIATQKALVAQIQPIIVNIISQQTTITSILSFSNYFNDDEFKIIDRFIKQDSIEDSSFYAPDVNSYNNAGTSNEFTGMTGGITGSVVTKIFNNYLQAKELYSVEGGDINLNSSLITVNARIIRGTFERLQNNMFTLSLYLGRGTMGSVDFEYASLTLTGTATSVSDNCVPDKDAPNAYATGSSVNFYITTGFAYFTHNVTQYERYAIQQELFDYGEACLRKTAEPIYDFGVTSSNFLALSSYKIFKDELELGEKIYLELDEDLILTPIVTKITVSYADKKTFNIEFSNTFTISDAEFKLMSLLDQSISMGKTLNYSSNNYNAWINSGAHTTVENYMNSAFDAAKNTIISATNQYQTWDSSGIWLRATDGAGGYEPEQIKMVNNGIFFTDDNFTSVNMGIGTFYDANIGKITGVVAPSIVGTMIAGQNLIIESEKKDGTTSVFRVDGDGAKLYNATFDIYNNRNTQITLNPYSGFAIGSYPLYSGTDYTINTANAKFWVDLNGNVHLKGTLEGVDGIFNGTVKARDYQDLNGKSMLVNSGSGSSSGYAFSSDYLDLYGLTVRNKSTGATTFAVSSNGTITINGTVNMDANSTITWNSSTRDPATTTATNTANSAANDVLSLASGTYTQAGLTFINQNRIYAPTVMFGSQAEGFNLGVLQAGYGSDGTQTTQVIELYCKKGIVISSDTGGISMYAYKGVWISPPASFNVYDPNRTRYINLATAIRTLNDRVNKLDGGSWVY